jgi:hypothetical protein
MAKLIKEEHLSMHQTFAPPQPKTTTDFTPEMFVRIVRLAHCPRFYNQK